MATTVAKSTDTAAYRRHAKVLGAASVLMVLILTGAVWGIRNQVKAVNSARQTVVERIRDVYALPESSSASPAQTLGEVVKEGMLPVQVDSVLAQLGATVLRKEWFAVQTPNFGTVGVAQNIVLGASGEAAVGVYVSYRDGRVASVGFQYRRRSLLPITAAGALRFLEREEASRVRRLLRRDQQKTR